MKFPDNVTADFERATLPPVMIDIEEIKQVIRNLINNAVDSLTNGGKRLLRTSCPDRKTITLQIKDTGCVIPQRTMVKIFEPFFSTKSKGTGLGLAVVKRIVEERQKGKVRVESVKDRGTGLYIDLPAQAYGGRS